MVLCKLGRRNAIQLLYFNLTLVLARQNAIHQIKKHQHKPINLADVYKQTELEIPNLHKALNVGRYAKKHFNNLIFFDINRKHLRKYRTIIIVFFCLIVFILFAVWRNQKLKKSFKLTQGKINYVNWGHKNGRFIIYVTFYVSDTKYECSTFLKCNDYKSEYLNKVLVNKEVLVAYDSLDYSNNSVILYKESYKHFGLTIPSNNIWIDGIFSCEK